MLEKTTESIQASLMEEKKSNDDDIDPLMCFECAEVFDSTEELKRHVKSHLSTMLEKGNMYSREKMESPVNTYSKIINDSNLKNTMDDSKSESSYFDTYMKARGLDSPAFGGHKRDKSPVIPQKQVTITVTTTSDDGKELKFICPICGKSCPSTDELGKHMEAHSGYTCNVCGKSYSTKGNLQTHMKKHNGDTGATCHYCNKSFASQAILKIHVRSHTGEKPFECDQCGVGFAKNIHLKRHMSIHTGIKPHQCEICQKRFSRSDHLKRHIQSIHTQDRPHLCSLCGKDFVRKYELNKHMKQLHWGFTVGENGNDSMETTYSNHQNVSNDIPGSEINTSMQKLQGAFTMGDNNNMVDVKDEINTSIEQEVQRSLTEMDVDNSGHNGRETTADLVEKDVNVTTAQNADQLTNY